MSFLKIKRKDLHVVITGRNAKNELIEMDRNNELTGDASYIFMKSKPVEELYDLVCNVGSAITHYNSGVG